MVTRFVIGALLTFCSFSFCSAETIKPLEPIESLDIPRYMGRWYEIAKYPNWFQKRCVSNTTAEYSLESDGTVKVVNQCIQEDERLNIVIGSAHQDEHDRSSKLKVRFAPQWLSFVPFVWGNYWVIDLDKDYSVSVVSEPKREYLWILSRKPQMNEVQYSMLLMKLKTLGFDISRIEKTNQSNDLSSE
jgi:apolipoprotein D and lipocalin family protein